MSMDNKIKQPNEIQVNNLIKELNNISINQLMPLSDISGKTKRILDCTRDDIQYMFWRENGEHNPLITLSDKVLKLYGNMENVVGNMLLEMRLGKNANVDVLKLLCIVSICEGYKQFFSIIADEQERNYDDIPEKDSVAIKNLRDNMIVERANDKADYREKYGKKELPLSQERFYDGQKYMIDKVIDILDN